MQNSGNNELQEYSLFLKDLAKSQSSDIFLNKGIEHASILMSVLFERANNCVRIYCNGFGETLICENPYWDALIKYLEKDVNNTLSVLVETNEHINEKPLLTLKEHIQMRANNTIQVKLLSEEGRAIINERFGKDHCNFAIFDTNKYRFEYDPEKYKAFGSFNQPKNCDILIDIFDRAFEASTALL